MQCTLKIAQKLHLSAFLRTFDTSHFLCNRNHHFGLSFLKLQHDVRWICTEKISAEEPFGTNSLEGDEKVSKLKKSNVNWFLRFKEFLPLVQDFKSSGDLKVRGLTLLRQLSVLPDVSSAERVKFAEQLMTTLREEKVVTNDHYEALLQCYLQSKLFDSFELFLKRMETDSVKPSQRIHLLILRYLGEIGKRTEASKYILNMHNRGLCNNEELKALLMYKYAASGDFQKSEEILKALPKVNKMRSSGVYATLLRVHVLKGNEEAIQKLVNEMKNLEIELSEDEFLTVLEAVATSRNFHLLPVIFWLLGSQFPTVPIQSLLIRFIYEGSIDDSLKLFEFLLQLNHLPLFFKTFIEELVAVNCPFEDIIQICERLKKYELSEYAMEHFLYLYLVKGDLENSINILEAMHKRKIFISSHYVWPLFIEFYKKYFEEGIFAVLKLMKNLEVELDEETFVRIIYPRMAMDKETIDRMNAIVPSRLPLFRDTYVGYSLRLGHFTKCLKFLEDLPLSNLTDYSFLNDSFFRAFTRFPISPEAVEIAKKARSFDHVGTLEYLIKNNREADALKLIEEFKKRSMKFDKVERFLGKKYVQGDIRSQLTSMAESEAAELDIPEEKSELKKILLKMPQKRSNLTASQMKMLQKDRVRNMTNVYRDIDDKEVHLAELEAKKQTTTSHLFRFLKDLVAAKSYKKASEIKKELLTILHADDNKLSPGMLSTFFKLAIIEGNVEEALGYYSELHPLRSHFRLDPLKEIMLCILLVKKRMFHDVKSVLEKLPSWNSSQESIERLIVTFLIEISKIGNIEFTKSVFEYMITKNYIVPNWNTQQVFVETYIHANDLKGAFAEYQSLANDHKRCPNTRNLTSAVLKSGEISYLDKIFEIGCTVQQPKYVKLAIMQAVADAGDEERLIECHKKFKTNMASAEWLVFFCNNPPLTTVGLLTLMSATCKQGEDVNVPFAVLFNKLKSTYDYENAKILQKMLSEKMSKISLSNQKELENFMTLSEILKRDKQN